MLILATCWRYIIILSLHWNTLHWNTLDTFWNCPLTSHIRKATLPSSGHRNVTNHHEPWWTHAPHKELDRLPGYPNRRLQLATHWQASTDSQKGQKYIKPCKQPLRGMGLYQQWIPTRTPNTWGFPSILDVMICQISSKVPQNTSNKLEQWWFAGRNYMTRWSIDASPTWQSLTSWPKVQRLVGNSCRWSSAWVIWICLKHLGTTIINNIKRCFL